ncbi:hypothetical protein [Halosimplex sp. TS25]|uniref:hypothetical protein n=1 Tax=Halosimplex rarum TaxID=3396619 RepID=UPI0039E97252
MTGNTDGSDAGSERLITTRGVLKGIGGIGAGAALGLGGVYAIADRSDHVDLGGLFGRWLPKKSPPATEPAEKSSPRTTPWEQDTVVVSIERDESVSGFEAAPDLIEEAADAWNEYIEADAPFDLTLSFEPDHEDPDVLFVEHSLMDCYGEYESPATEDPELTEQVCVGTLTDAPDETPITADIGTGLGGEAFYGLVARHALGRVVGYDVWSDPVDVMTPTILFGPAHADHPDATFMLGRPSHRDDAHRRLAESIAEEGLPSIKNSRTGSLGETITSVREEIEGVLDEDETDMSEWAAAAEDFGYPRYVEAYESTVLSDEVPFLEATVAMMTDLVANNTNEEIAGSEELDALLERLETVVDWPATHEAWDVRIHRHYTDAVWSEWTAERA